LRDKKLRNCIRQYKESHSEINGMAFFFYISEEKSFYEIKCSERIIKRRKRILSQKRFVAGEHVCSKMIRFLYEKCRR